MLATTGPRTARRQAATVFCVAVRRHVKSPGHRAHVMPRQMNCATLVNTTSHGVSSGLTSRVSTCHNHKFDPITQAAFNRFKAGIRGCSIMANIRLRTIDPCITIGCDRRSPCGKRLDSIRARWSACETQNWRYPKSNRPPRRTAVNADAKCRAVCSCSWSIRSISPCGVGPTGRSCIDECGRFSPPVKLAARCGCEDGAIATLRELQNTPNRATH